MSNPNIAPTSSLPRTPEDLPLAIWTAVCPDDYDQILKSSKGNLTASSALYGSNAVLMPSVRVPIKLTVNEKFLKMAEAGHADRCLAFADAGVPQRLHRSAAGMNIVEACWAVLHPQAREYVREAMETTFMQKSGAEWGLNRLRDAHPRKGAKPSRPPTIAEVEEALAHMGFDRPYAAGRDWTPLPFEPLTPGGESVRFNMSANNGYPVGGTMKEAEAAKLAKQVANALRAEGEALTKGNGEEVHAMYLQKMVSEPHVVLKMFKAKAECVPASKIYGKQLRLYSAIGAQHKIICAPTVQRWKQHGTGIGHPMLVARTSTVPCGFGSSSLAKGGALQIFTRLETMQEQRAKPSGLRPGKVVNGDDMLMVVTWEGKTAMWSVDTWRMDISTLSGVKGPFIRAISNRLAKIDYFGGHWWAANMLQHYIVFSGAMCMGSKDMTPSGMDAVTEVNTGITTMGGTRIEDELNEELKAGRPLTEELVKEVVERVMNTLGYRAEVEQYRESDDGIWGCLGEGLTYLGYDMEYNGKGISMVSDPRRFMSRVPYPPRVISDSVMMHVAEAMRVASVAINMGSGTCAFPLAYVEAAYASAYVDLVRSFDMAPPQADEGTFGYAEELLGGVDLAGASRLGLIEALERGPHALWPDGHTHRPWSLRGVLSETQESLLAAARDNRLRGKRLSKKGNIVHPQMLAPEMLSANMDSFVRDAREALGLPEPAVKPPALDHAEIERTLLKAAAPRVPPGLERVKTARRVVLPRPTHPHTRDNWGRMPPTASWKPDQPPKPKGFRAHETEAWQREEDRADNEYPPGYEPASEREANYRQDSDGDESDISQGSFEDAKARGVPHSVTGQNPKAGVRGGSSNVAFQSSGSAARGSW